MPTMFWYMTIHDAAQTLQYDLQHLLHVSVPCALQHDNFMQFETLPHS